MILFGGEIKALGDGKIAGYLVRFTDADTPDLSGDFFDARTDYDIVDGDRVTIYYNHGLDPVLKRRKLGSGTLTMQDAGVWMEGQIHLRDEYEQAVYKLIGAGKQGLSSGTLPSLMEREPVGKAMWIKAWPLGKDASITPTPAAGPILTAVQTMKTWAEATKSLKAQMPEVTGDVTTQSATVESSEPAFDTTTAKRLLVELDLLAL